jgi:hypothetical protein
MKSDLKKQCLKLYQKIVCGRDIFCQRPGCTARSSSGHHVFGRSNNGSAFEPDGGLGLCVSDHDSWARSNPAEVHAVLKRKVGAKRYDELLQLSKSVVRLREYDMNHYVKRLEEQLMKLNK